MRGLRSIRPLKPDSLRGIEPATVGKRLPRLELVDPTILYVEENYQRSMAGGNSIKLIRKIYSGWNWAHYKPPICVRLKESGGVLVVIDGQHTATAAASLRIPKIPIFVVTAEETAARAQSFVGHNRDRLGLTPMAIHRADVVSGNPLALMVDKACRAAGAEILATSISLKSTTKVGQTIAIGTIKVLARTRGQEALTRVLKVLVRAGRGPIRAEEITAAALALEDAAPEVDDRLVAVIKSQSAERWRAAAASMAADTDIATPIAMATMWRDALGMSRPMRKLKATKPSNVLRTPAKVQKATPEPQTTATVPEPPPKPPEPPSAPTLPPGPPQPNIVVRDGIVLNIARRQVVKGGSRVNLTEEETAAVAALMRVMPAILPSARIAAKAFGHQQDANYLVKALVDGLDPRLRAIGLAVREVPKMGFTFGAT